MTSEAPAIGWAVSKHACEPAIIHASSLRDEAQPLPTLPLSLRFSDVFPQINQSKMNPGDGRLHCPSRMATGLAHTWEHRPRRSARKRRVPASPGAGRSASTVSAVEQHDASGASIVTPPALTSPSTFEDKHDGLDGRERPERRIWTRTKSRNFGDSLMSSRALRPIVSPPLSTLLAHGESRWKRS